MHVPFVRRKKSALCVVRNSEQVIPFGSRFNSFAIDNNQPHHYENYLCVSFASSQQLCATPISLAVFLLCVVYFSFFFLLFVLVGIVVTQDQEQEPLLSVWELRARQTKSIVWHLTKRLNLLAQVLTTWTNQHHNWTTIGTKAFYKTWPIDCCCYCTYSSRSVFLLYVQKFMRPMTRLS